MKVVSKHWGGIVSVLTVIFAVLCMAAPAMAATWVVNPDGSGNFTTIQEAVDSDWTSGDTIQIEYAVYQESVSVYAGGKNLTIAGVLSPGGDKPVIDGMNISVIDSMDGAIDYSDLYEAFDGVSFDRGLSDHSLGLINGSFVVSNLYLTNSSGMGLYAEPDAEGQTLYVTGIEAADNGLAGIWTQFSNTRMTDIGAYDNGDWGIVLNGDGVVLEDIESTGNSLENHVYGGICVYGSGAVLEDVMVTENGDDGIYIYGDSAVLGDVECTGNGGDGIYIYGDSAVLEDIVSIENGIDGIGITIPYMVVIVADSAIVSGDSDFTLTDILVADNGWDGLWVADESVLYYDVPFDISPVDGPAYYMVNISRVVSTGNSVNGICLEGIYDFSASDLFLAENGYDTFSPVFLLAEAPVREGARVVDEEDWDEGGNGLLVLDSGYGLIEDVASINNSVAGVCLDYTNDVTLRYVAAAEHHGAIFERMDGYSNDGYGIFELNTIYTEIEDCLAYNNDVDYVYEYSDYFMVNSDSLTGDDAASLYDYYPNTVTRLQISDPFNAGVVPTILSWDSDCDLLAVGQPEGPINEFYPPARYHDAGGIYAEVSGVGGTVDFAFVIPPEFPSVTAEGLSLWNDYERSFNWTRTADSYNTLFGDERHVGAIYNFSALSMPDGANAMDGIPHEDSVRFAPFWYEQPGGDDPGVIVTGNSTSGILGGTGTGVGDAGVTPTPTPVPTAGADEGAGGNVTPTMTPVPVGESASPTVPVTQMPADAGASGNGGFLPWAVLLVVLIAIAGGVYYMKYQQK